MDELFSRAAWLEAKGALNSDCGEKSHTRSEDSEHELC